MTWNDKINKSIKKEKKRKLNLIKGFDFCLQKSPEAGPSEKRGPHVLSVNLGQTRGKIVDVDPYWRSRSSFNLVKISTWMEMEMENEEGYRARNKERSGRPKIKKITERRTRERERERERERLREISSLAVPVAVCSFWFFLFFFAFL